MEIHSSKIELNGVIADVSAETTRKKLIDLFGEPDDVGGFSRKKKRGKILKYGETEFHFVGDKETDTLFLVYRERLVVDEYIPEISIMFNQRSITMNL